LIAGVESRVVIGEKPGISFLKKRIVSEERVDIFTMPLTSSLP